MTNFPFSASAEARFAADAAQRAGLLTARLQRALPPALTKDDRSPVTVADFAAQAVVAGLLASSFPQASLVAEERADALRNNTHAALTTQVVEAVRTVFPNVTTEEVLAWIDRGGASPSHHFWVLDPIDGTKGFLRGSQFAIALALVENGEVNIGALACPNLPWPQGTGRGVLALATRGGGAWWASLADTTEWRPLQVSSESRAEHLRLLRSYESAHTHAQVLETLINTVGSRAAPIRMDSQAKYAVLASGGAEVYMRVPSPSQPDYKEKIWDQAAGALIVEEAGGRVTDLDGHPLDFSTGRRLENNRGILATNGKLHATILNALRAIEAAQ